MTTISDIENMIAQVSLKDRHAFSLLYNATSAKLFGVCLRILNNRADAEEALQEAYVKIWNKASTYTSNGYSPMTWLITLTRNLAIDKLRARKDVTDDIDDNPQLQDAGPTPETAAIASDTRRQIDVCLEQLKDEKSEAVRGAYLEGYSYQELADQFDVPLNTMRTWLRRSLLKLKDCLSR